jgi:hypothetical protein
MFIAARNICLYATALVAVLTLRSAPAQQEQVFFGNLHSHTSYSDGTGTPAEAYVHARDVAKLHFLALTEHNHAEALGSDNIGIGANSALYNGSGPESLISTASAMTRDGQFIALYGQEFSTISTGNHINVFDVGEVINVAKGRFDLLLNFLSTRPDTTGQQTILMFNHPQNTLNPVAREYGIDDFSTTEQFISRIGAQARLIQMINGVSNPSTRTAANPDENAYLKYLRMGFKLAPTADQDNHSRDWGSATPARTAVVATSLTKASLLDALRRRHVYATEDPNLSVVIKVNSRLCGDVIAPLPAPGELAIEYRISDSDEPQAEYEIQVWRGSVGGPVAQMVSSVTTLAGGGSGTVEDVAFSGEAQFFFFKVIQFNEDGETDSVWTAPVWFQSQTDAGGATPVGGTPTTPVTDTAVASRRSEVFHVSGECLDAQRIKPENRITGADARRGKQLHQGCPRRSGQ